MKKNKFYFYIFKIEMLSVFIHLVLIVYQVLY